MLNFILEIIFTILFIIFLVFDVIAGSWLFVVLDAAIIILGIVDSILTYKSYKKNNASNRENK